MGHTPLTFERLIGAQHRIKKTAEGAAHPTRLFVQPNGKSGRWLNLVDENAERDFVLGLMPTEFVDIESLEDFERIPNEVALWQDIKLKELERVRWQLLTRKVGNTWQVSQIPLRHVTLEAISKAETKELPEQLVMAREKRHARTGKLLRTDYFQITRVPIAFDGLREGDLVVAAMGGSGGNFIGSLHKRGEHLGAEVWRTPGFRLKDARGESNDKAHDAKRLVDLFKSDQDFFYEMYADERELVFMGELWKLREQSQKARIASGQRLRQQAIGAAFRNVGDPTAGPIGDIEYEFARLKATDAGFLALEAEESKRTRMLDTAVKGSELFQHLSRELEFKGVLGASIAGAILPTIGNILRFAQQIDHNSPEVQKTYRKEAEWEKEAGLAELLLQIGNALPRRLNRYRRNEFVRKWAREQGMDAAAEALTEAIRWHRKRGEMRRKARDKGRAKLRRYQGVDVRRWGNYGDTWPHEQFPRFRGGQRFRGSPTCRQALYDFFDVVLRKTDSPWNARIVQIKAELRKKHPEKVIVRKSLVNIFRRVEQVVVGTGAVYIPLAEYKTLDDLRSLLKQAEHVMDPERYVEISAEIDEAKATGSETRQVFSKGHIHNMSRWRLAGALSDAIYDSWLRFANAKQEQREREQASSAVA